MNYDDLVILDFETYYSDEYSLALSAYNMSEYVRDEQFLIHGVGIQAAGYAPYWIAGHDEALKECQALDLWDRPVGAHNTAFDGFILHEHADIHIGRYCDTLSMARATMGHHISHSLDSVAQVLGVGKKLDGLANTKGKRYLTPDELKKLSIYCMNDSRLCMGVFQKLLRYMPEAEMKLIDITLRMFCDPRLLVDIPLATNTLELEKTNKAAAVFEANTDIDILMSNDKFADLLRSLGVVPPTKISPRTNKEAYAFAKTDAGFKQLLVHPNEAVAFAATARQQVKSTLNETRAQRLINAGNNNQRLPILLNYAAAHTLRWSGGNKLNLQNLPRGGVLRKAILAPQDHQILVLDLSQIEARITAWLSGQHDILAAFAAYDADAGPDVYRIMAHKIYTTTPLDEISSAQRFIGKVCVLGLGFGMGWFKLKTTLAIGFAGPPVEITEQEARYIVQVYRQSNQAIVSFWDRLNSLLALMATQKNLNYQLGPIRFMYRMIELPNGLALRYPGLHLTDNGTAYTSRDGETNLWGGMLLENIVQALARCVVAEHMLEISKTYNIATMTHDEIVTVVPTDVVERAFEQQKKIMTTPPVWAPDLPLAVEGGWDVRYSK